MKKRCIIFIIVLLMVILFLVGFMLMFRNQNNIYLKSDKFTFEYGDEVCSKIGCYIDDATSTKKINELELIAKDLIIKDDKFVSDGSDILNIGRYDIEIKNQKQSKKFLIEVIDSTPPEFVEFSELIILEQNSIDVDLTSFFKADDLFEVEITLQGDIDLSKVEEYTVNVIATDENDQKSQREATIKIIDFESAKKENSVSKNIEGKIYKSSVMMEYENNKNKSKETKKSNYNQSSSQNSNNGNKNNTSSNSNSNKPADNGNTASARYRKDISDSYARQINVYRKENNLSELPITSEAQAEADRRSKEISVTYSHDGAGYGFGENIGYGGIGSDFITAWKNSPSHNAAMLREQNVAMAVSVYEVNGMWYAVTSFRMNY